MENKIKAFKGFNKNMICRNFQYEEGKEYVHNGVVKACSSGFHACEHPLDCFSYYSPADSVYHEVELDGSISKDSDDSKVAASYIKIGARLDIVGLCKAAFEFVRSRCTNEHNAEPGQPATAGEYGAATAGEYGAATAGYRGAATAGEYGAATAGEYGAATAGEYGAATAGYRGAATSKGSSSTGENGLSVARGNHVKVRGGLGAVLVIAEEYDYSSNIKEYKVAVVDGKDIKADTWYCLNNGEFVEVTE